mmetsp:Transcript_52323/g.156132  ORF Transcript_52323/g.156132 Transcript_52323/m.156132 type:complete len:315 (-) Transcript_52323:163-1107(-)
MVQRLLFPQLPLHDVQGRRLGRWRRLVRWRGCRYPWRRLHWWRWLVRREGQLLHGGYPQHLLWRLLQRRLLMQQMRGRRAHGGRGLRRIEGLVCLLLLWHLLLLLQRVGLLLQVVLLLIVLLLQLLLLLLPLLQLLLLQLLLLLLLARSARRGCPGRHRQHRRFHLHGGQRFLSCPEVCEAPLGGGDSLLQAALGGPPRCGLPADLLRKDFRACRDDLHEPQHLAELPDDGGASHVLRPPILRPHRGALPPDLRREALQLPAEISVDLAATCLDVAPELCTGGGHFSAEARGRCVYPGPELAPQLCSQAPHLGA